MAVALESPDCSALDVAAITESAAGLSKPLPLPFFDALFAAAARAVPSAPAAACARLAAALGGARAQPPSPLRALLAARLEAGTWDGQAPALVHAASQLHRMGHAWTAAAAWALLARAAASLPDAAREPECAATARGNQCREGRPLPSPQQQEAGQEHAEGEKGQAPHVSQEEHQQGGEHRGLGPLHIAELLIALRPALQQAPRWPCGGGTAGDCGGSDSSGGGRGGSSSEAGMQPRRQDSSQDISRGGGAPGSDCVIAGGRGGGGGGDPLLRLWQHAVVCVELSVNGLPGGELGAGTEESAPAAADGAARDRAVHEVLALLHAMHSLPALRAAGAGAPSRCLLRLSLRLSLRCGLHQLIPLAAAWRALGEPLHWSALMRLARGPLAPLSSAKLAAAAAALGGAPPGARRAKAAAAAVASEALARLRAGRMPAAAVVEMCAALPHLVRLGWPADCAAALLTAAEVAAGDLQPPQLWQLHLRNARACACARSAVKGLAAVTDKRL
ncbi:hypothetical protein MNEG_12912 [Monoraphidium neglectum]|uniref:Uncharacterized protein n=1 Tax=Monoraphidium neglectum TaxID=145388 RepID=A0A0D2MJ71_9CHLO|nr:hypothetical protein MNEG_12912 [Monoraphidium neglectum]KIY95050.1 hypothetical protein MNEG_12912 [Monoraphidium neglectum]|eukprot:XP_013894070.1 hypothetical protein MNEG_12912 [Monoraphidium neglectum]